MASGKIHFKGNVITAAVTLPLSIATLNPQFIVGSVVSHVVAVFYGPDTDLEQFTHGENILGKIPLIGMILKILVGLFTLPYATVIGHRSQFSHTPVLSDFIRYIYLELWIFIFDAIFQYNSPTIFNAILKTFTQATGEGYVIWLTWLVSPLFWGFFLTAIVQTCVHTLILDGGMVEKPRKNSNKNKRHYILGKEWYNKCREWFN